MVAQPRRFLLLEQTRNIVARDPVGDLRLRLAASATELGSTLRVQRGEA